MSLPRALGTRHNEVFLGRRLRVCLLGPRRTKGASRAPAVAKARRKPAPPFFDGRWRWSWDLGQRWDLGLRGHLILWRVLVPALVPGPLLGLALMMVPGMGLGTWADAGTGAGTWADAGTGAGTGTWASTDAQDDDGTGTGIGSGAQVGTGTVNSNGVQVVTGTEVGTGTQAVLAFASSEIITGINTGIVIINTVIGTDTSTY